MVAVALAVAEDFACSATKHLQLRTLRSSVLRTTIPVNSINHNVNQSAVRFILPVNTVADVGSDLFSGYFGRVAVHSPQRRLSRAVRFLQTISLTGD